MLYRSTDCRSRCGAAMETLLVVPPSIHERKVHHQNLGSNT
jgi:hypothetical protein